MKLLFGSAQDIGKRKEQQDDFYVSDPCRTDGSNPGLLVVCDGIGGLPCGKEAAQITCDAVKNSIMSEKRISDIHGALLKSLRDANRALLDFIVSKGKVMECGCTLVAAALQDDMLFWISAGDSHIYHISGKSITQLNEDHTYGKVLDAAVARGDIDKSIADKHSKRDALTSFVSFWEVTKVSSGKMRILPGDSVLLCSDGLYRELSEEEIIDAYDPDPMKWAGRLIEEALLKNDPYQDNVTVVIASVIE